MLRAPCAQMGVINSLVLRMYGPLLKFHIIIDELANFPSICSTGRHGMFLIPPWLDLQVRGLLQ